MVFSLVLSCIYTHYNSSSHYRASLASFPGSPLALTKNKNRGGESGINSHVISRHNDVTAIITKVVTQLQMLWINLEQTFPTYPLYAFNIVAIFESYSHMWCHQQCGYHHEVHRMFIMSPITTQMLVGAIYTFLLTKFENELGFIIAYLGMQVIRLLRW